MQRILALCPHREVSLFARHPEYNFLLKSRPDLLGLPAEPGAPAIFADLKTTSTYQGEIKKRQVGSMISMVQGKALGFSLFTLQDRGQLYIAPGVEVYEGMVIGNTAKGEEMMVNPTKGKQLTNVRSSGTDEAVRLVPPVQVTLESAIEFIADDSPLKQGLFTPGLFARIKLIGSGSYNAKDIYTQMFGGRVIVNMLLGEVTTVIQTQANNTKLIAHPTSGSDVDLCAVSDIAALEVGGLLVPALNSFATALGTADDAGWRRLRL